MMHYSRPDTPALERKAKCQSYLDYRDPGLSDFDDDAIMQGTTDSNSNVVMMSEGVAVFRQQGFSVKRKLCEDYEDREHQLELIVEKFQKTDIVPDRGQHAPILAPYSMDEVENQTDDEKLIMLDGEEDSVESPVATTPTNPRNMQRLFLTLAAEEDGLVQAHETEHDQLSSESDSQLFTKQRYLKKLTGKTTDSAQPVAGSSRKTLKLPLAKLQ